MTSGITESKWTNVKRWQILHFPKNNIWGKYAHIIHIMYVVNRTAKTLSTQYMLIEAYEYNCTTGKYSYLLQPNANFY